MPSARPEGDGRQARRMAQNRAAQRAFRQRRHEYLNYLERRVAELEFSRNNLELLSARVRELELTVSKLLIENSYLHNMMTKEIFEGSIEGANGLKSERQDPMLSPPKSFDVSSLREDLVYDFSNNAQNADSKSPPERLEYCSSAPPCAN